MFELPGFAKMSIRTRGAIQIFATRRFEGNDPQVWHHFEVEEQGRCVRQAPTRICRRACDRVQTAEKPRIQHDACNCEKMNRTPFSFHENFNVSDTFTLTLGTSQ
jgi:hypothetical protein